MESEHALSVWGLVNRSVRFVMAKVVSIATVMEIIFAVGAKARKQ